MIRHISFDFWNTVGKPNKEYAHHRSSFLASLFKVSHAEAKAAYSLVKGELDHAAETQGVDWGRKYNIVRLCQRFVDIPDDMMIAMIGRKFDELFAEYPPTVDPNLVEILMTRCSDITLSIGSNTNFIEGKTIHEFVTSTLPFDFSIFSDEIGCSKPNPKFFEHVTRAARNMNPQVLKPSDIVHTGDNQVCDVAGAIRSGMKYAYVRNADETASVLSKILKV